MAGFKGYSITIAEGNVVRDPELKHTTSGTPVCDFAIAVEQGYKDNAYTEYYNCTAFGKLAAAIHQYVKKGQPLRVTGQIKTQKWERDGVKHQRTNLIVNDFGFLPGGKREQAEGGQRAPAQEDSQDSDSSELPF